MDAVTPPDTATRRFAGTPSGKWECENGAAGTVMKIYNMTNRWSVDHVANLVNDAEKAAGRAPPEGLQDLLAAITYNPKLFYEKQNANGAAAAAAAPLTLTLEPLWPEGFTGDVPPPDWLVPGLLLNGHLTMIYGMGGSGKSLFMLTLSMGAALGIEVMGHKPVKPVKVLLINVEDDALEMQRRMWAARTKLPKTSAQEMQYLETQLFTINPPDSNFALVERRADNTIGKTALHAQIVATCKREGIGLISFDPFISMSRGLDENSAEMQELLEPLRQIGRDLNIPVAVIHHTSKSGRGGDQNAGRGSSTISALARVVVTVETMNEAECGGYGVEADECWSYFRLQTAKSNYGSRRGKHWYRIVEVTMPLGYMVPAIEVAVFTKESVLDAPWLRAFLETVKAGPIPGRRFPPISKNSKPLVEILIDRYGLSLSAAGDALKELMTAGILDEDEYQPTAGDRHKTRGLFVVRWPEPEQGEFPNGTE